MGSFVPMAFQAMQFFQTVNSLGSIFDQGRERDASNMAVRQLQQRQQLEEYAASRDAQREREEIVQKAVDAEKTRKTALKRNMARRNAQFGAQGLSTEDGSSEAVLLGLFSESEEEKNHREKLDKLRYAAVDQKLETLGRRNTLKKTQMAQSERFRNELDPYETIESLYRLF